MLPKTAPPAVSNSMGDSHSAFDPNSEKKFSFTKNKV